MKKFFFSSIIIVVLLSCSKNDETLLSHLETDSYLEGFQFKFLKQFEQADLKIDANEIITGTAYKSDEPLFIKTTTKFVDISTLSFPSGSKYVLQLLYENEDTIVVYKETSFDLKLFRSINRGEFVEFHSRSLRDVNDNKIHISNIAMKNATVGYFYLYKPFGTNTSEVSLMKIEGNQVKTLTNERPGKGGNLNIFPNGKLFKTQYRPNRLNIAVVSESINEGLTWTNDTISLSGYSYQGISEIVENDFILSFSSGRIYKSNDAKNWIELKVVEPGSPNFFGIEDYHFLNKNDGFIITKVGGSGYDEICDLYETSDGGTTWLKVNDKNFYARKIHFYSKKIGIAYNNKAIQITRDGGVTWELIAIKEPKPFIN